MVSFQASTSPNWRKRTHDDQLDDDASNKRKWEDPARTGGILEKKSRLESTNSIFEIELHLETPLPFEWQRCLDIQSGQIHFYNTRTHKRTSRDPRNNPEPPSPDHQMSLDLELNLPCESQRRNHGNDHLLKGYKSNQSGSISVLGGLFKDCSRDDKQSKGLPRCPSWLAFEREQEEMVATVCTRCHMLVMLCKSSPACPNCKFLHPPNQSTPELFKQRLSLLC